MLRRVKLDNTLLTYNQGNFKQATAWIPNQTLVTEVRETCTSTVPPVSLVNPLTAVINDLLLGRKDTL